LGAEASAGYLEASSVPKYLRARAPQDDREARTIRKLAAARHAPADWIERARIVALSWDGLGVAAIAAGIGCHENTVRRWMHRFNADGIDGLGNRPGCGRKRRITEAERSRIIALARSVPPGQLARDAGGELSADDERGPAQWTLDTLSQAARAGGIQRPAQPGPADPAGREGALAADPQLGDQHRSRVRPKRTAVVELYTSGTLTPRWQPDTRPHLRRVPECQGCQGPSRVRTHAQEAPESWHPVTLPRSTP
jgi:transposase